jgi:hypothetical protein
MSMNILGVSVKYLSKRKMFRTDVMEESGLYSEIALPRNPFGIGHMYIYTFFLRMTDTITSQNIGLSS